MGHQIIKQPNGLFAVFSTIVDNFLVYNKTKEQLKKFYLRMERARINKEIDEIVEKIEKGVSPYYQFSMTFEQAVEEIQENHGKQAVNKYRKIRGVQNG